VSFRLYGRSSPVSFNLREGVGHRLNSSIGISQRSGEERHAQLQPPHCSPCRLGAREASGVCISHRGADFRRERLPGARRFAVDPGGHGQRGGRRGPGGFAPETAAGPKAAAPGAGWAGQGLSQGYTIEQAASWRARLSTNAFSALAFLTGMYGADTFMPAGKVADYFGFQYMRDIDAAEAGHNTMFLTKICNNVLAILDDDKKTLLKSLATDQAPLYSQVADKRLILIKAFRQNMEGAYPTGTAKLSRE
jgi:hypothetical protein